jgi:polyhydroxybutyrate depolymerase
MKSFFESRRGAVIAATMLLAALGASEASASGCGAKQEAGRHEMTIQSGGKERRIVFFAPTGYNPDKPTALVLDLHGSNSNADEQLDRSGWERIAERDGAIVAGLQGVIPADRPGMVSWYVPGVTQGDDQKDEAYISEAISALETKFCIDATRIYATGFSGGARMLSQYLCDANEKIAAAGMISGLRAGYPKAVDGGKFEPDAATCKPKKPVSIIAFAGKADAVNPFEGGGRPYWGYGADAAFTRWIDIAACKDAPATSESGVVTKTTVGGCASGASLASVVIADGGHTWPSSTALLKITNALGKVSYDVDATEEAWRFFQQSTK